MSTKKNQFSNLKRGESKIKEGLGSFITNQEDGKPFSNPLNEKKPTQRKRAGTKNFTQKPTQKIEKAKAKKSDTVQQSPHEPEQNISGVSKTKPNNESTSKIVEHEKLETIGLPSDFSSHTIRFSKDQLVNFKKVVNYKKWKESPKFTVKEGFYEAIEELMKNRSSIKKFPDDIGTYTLSASADQLSRLNSFVGEVKFKDDDSRYSLTRAVFEGIQKYIRPYKGKAFE